MTETSKLSTPIQFIKKYKVYILWFLLISVYLYRTLLPEVVFVNASGTRVEQVTISIPADEKIWRNIEHGKSKAFRFQPSRIDGMYKLSIILNDGTIIRSGFTNIKAWNFGQKVLFELLPDKTIRADFEYSLF